MRKIIFLLFVLCAHAKLFAQPQMPVVAPASPEASALAKYINYPVNYSTGLVNINIPLYEIKAGDLTLPISISYHASGIKAKENSGWVGLGWTLNAEPSISRSAQGLPDERGYLENNHQKPAGIIGEDPSYLDLMVKGTGTYEETPDEFYYNLLGKSGGFFFARNYIGTTDLSYKIIPHPYEPIKISCSLTNKQLPKFEITDDNGIYYRFGQAANNDAVTEIYQADANSSITQWKATEVTSQKTGEKMTFEYHGTTIEDYQSSNEIITVEDRPNNYLPIPTFIRMNSQCYYVVPRVGYDPSTKEGETQRVDCSQEPAQSKNSRTYQRKLNKITFSGGHVSFKKDSQNQLSSITVYNDESTAIRTIVFVRSLYYNNNNFDQRYKLDEIRILDKNGNIEEKYSFTYNTRLAYNKANCADHWGYTMGIGICYGSSVPGQQITAWQRDMPESADILSCTIGNASKEPNPQVVQGGILTSITYPTGGKSEFIYEANRYYNPTKDTLKIAGGLRIAQITDRDSTGNTLVRKFKYGEDESGAGYIKHIPKLSDYMTEQEKAIFAGDPTRLRTYTSNTDIDLFYSNGSPVVYPQVTEYRIGQGKTIYYYEHSYVNPRNPRDPKFPYIANLRNGWKDGLLVKQEEYALRNNSYALASKKTFTYSSFKDTIIKEGRVIQTRLGYVINNEPPKDQVINHYTSDIQTGCKRLTSEETTTYDGVTPITTRKDYTYDAGGFHMYPIKITSNNSRGVTITEEFKYPQDITMTGTAEIARQKLTATNQVSALLEHKKTTGSAVEKTVTEYAVFNGTNNSPACPALVKTNTGNGFADEVRLRYHQYDDHGNPLSMSYEGGQEIVFIWGYKYRYPIAKIEGASYSEVVSALSAEGTSFLKLAQAATPSSIEGLRTRLPNAHITTYSYKPLVGIVSETDPNGISTYYDYDNFGRLLRILDNDRNILKQYEYHLKQ